MAPRRKLRIIHNLARSGSTLLCKCLGCMDGVKLLSELHPLAWKLFNPVRQAVEWFGLLSPADLAELQHKDGVDYARVIALIEARCSERGDALVLRDWAHLDYTGLPFLRTPSFRPLLYWELADDFDIVRIATTREPVAQWQSLTELAIMREPLRTGALTLDQYLLGYRRYAELCAEIGFVRYEDLLRDSRQVMAKLCRHLEVELDAGFVDKWHLYKTITGDVNNPRASSKMEMPRKRPIENELKERLLANADYRQACALLSYDLVDRDRDRC